MSRVVLDASVVIAAALREPGGDRAMGHSTDPLVSAVNYSEVLTRLGDLGHDKGMAARGLALLGFEVVDFDREQAESASELRAATKAQGLSLGDRACLALAIRHGATALTADRSWARLDLPVQVELVR